MSIETPLLIFYCAASAWVFAEGTGWIQTFKFTFDIKSLKPLDCPLCLAFWLTLIVFTVKDGPNLYSVLYALTASLLSIYISKQIDK